MPFASPNIVASIPTNEILRKVVLASNNVSKLERICIESKQTVAAQYQARGTTLDLANLGLRSRKIQISDRVVESVREFAPRIFQRVDEILRTPAVSTPTITSNHEELVAYFKESFYHSILFLAAGASIYADQEVLIKKIFPESGLRATHIWRRMQFGSVATFEKEFNSDSHKIVLLSLFESDQVAQILAHEYTHAHQKAWGLSDEAYKIRDAFCEGLAIQVQKELACDPNYHSLIVDEILLRYLLENYQISCEQNGYRVRPELALPQRVGILSPHSLGATFFALQEKENHSDLAARSFAGELSFVLPDLGVWFNSQMRS